MDPITLIVTALAAGATSGVTDTLSSAVKDAYTNLVALVKKRFAGRPDAELVLAKHENAPQTWKVPLAAELGEAGADRDSDLVAAAQALMSLVDAAGSRTGKYLVDVRGSQGVQIGEHNKQQNIFNVPPGSSGERG
jgi:archaellum component FlaG (FlaF/FlaG flagellin family)